MSIKCGNCHGYHERIDQVANCHNSTSAIEPATDKQVSYIASLMKERKVPLHLKEMVEGTTLTKADASIIIGQLKLCEKIPGSWSDYTKADIEGAMPTPGTYTVPIGNGDHRTVRIRKPHPKANFLVAEYLYGPDNSNDFKRFAREAKDGFKLTPEFKLGNHDPDTYIVNALRVIMLVDIENLKEMGYQYALRSNRCYRCGRKLTVPTSIHRGMGPDCAGRN